jgi:hypothetical protein
MPPSHRAFMRTVQMRRTECQSRTAGAGDLVQAVPALISGCHQPATASPARQGLSQTDMAQSENLGGFWGRRLPRCALRFRQRHTDPLCPHQHHHRGRDEPHRLRNRDNVNRRLNEREHTDRPHYLQHSADQERKVASDPGQHATHDQYVAEGQEQGRRYQEDVLG